VQWKGHLPAGQVCPHPVIALDLHPTALAAAGGAAAPEWKLDGVDLLPYLKGEKQGPPHDTLYWRFQQQRAIRQGDWKLVQSRRGAEWELYHLGEDIGEQHNLADKRPDRVKELREAWQAWNAELMEPQWVRQDGRTPGAGRRGPLKARFQRLDRNGDGELTPEEVPNANLFRRLDRNGDGRVTPGEAAEALAKGRSQ